MQTSIMLVALAFDHFGMSINVKLDLTILNFTARPNHFQIYVESWTTTLIMVFSTTYIIVSLTLF